MSTIKKSLSPLNSSDRILSLDIMRGVVLLGILIMNINGMGLAGAYGDPTVSGGATGWNLTTWFTANLAFEGTMRALFSLLFGVGMFIFMDRLEKKGAGINAANIYFRRLMWLLVFGLIHGYLLLWTGEILYQYALMGFLVFSFRNLPPIKLTFIAVLLFSIGALWNYSDYKKDVKFVENVELVKNYKLEGKTLSRELQGVDRKWENREWERSSEGIAEYSANMRKGYLDVVAFLAPENQHYDENWPYRYDLWDVLSMMLLGIALFKWNILSAEKSYKFYGIMAALGYLIGLSINYYEIQSIMQSNFSLLSFSKSNITYDLGRVPVAIGHVGAIMLFCKLPILRWLKSSLAAVGKMALTNYVMHSVFAMFIFTGAGFGLFGTFQRFELLYIVFVIWIFQLIASSIWLKYYQYGPLEWIWRNLSYLKKHPLKKER
tara:strand:+ start:33807 stop:35108 length:1302 start_codon:yes stop_codon:yes gene_type:complete